MLKQQTKLPVRLYARLSKDDGDADKESNSITNHDVMYRGWITPKNITS